MPTPVTSDVPFSWVLNNPTLAFSLLGIVMLVAFYIYKRAGSVLFVRDRLWRLLGGQAQFSTVEFEQLKQDARELEHFKFEFDVPVRSLEQAANFQQWCSGNKLTPADLSMAKDHIEWGDFSQPRMKCNLDNLRRRSRITAVMMVVLSVALALSVVAATSQYLMVSYPDSPYFYVSEKDVKFSLLSQDKLTTETCKSPQALAQLDEKTDFPVQKFKSICEDFGSTEVVKSISDKLVQQRIAVGSLSIFFFLLFIWVLNGAIKYDATKRVIQQLNRIAHQRRAGQSTTN